jgi:hypothetical protein
MSFFRWFLLAWSFIFILCPLFAEEKSKRIELDTPFLFETAFRWKSSLGWDYNPNSQYFGIGEKSMETLKERPRNQPGLGEYNSAN